MLPMWSSHFTVSTNVKLLSFDVVGGELAFRWLALLSLASCDCVEDGMFSKVLRTLYTMSDGQRERMKTYCCSGAPPVIVVRPTRLDYVRVRDTNVSVQVRIAYKEIDKRRGKERECSKKERKKERTNATNELFCRRSWFNGGS